MMKKIRQWQNAFLGHVMRRRGLENLAVTGRIEGRRAMGRRRHYLDSLYTSREDNVSSTQLIKASEDREFWHHDDTVANVVTDGMAP